MFRKAFSIVSASFLPSAVRADNEWFCIFLTQFNSRVTALQSIGGYKDDRKGQEKATDSQNFSIR
jgi:hypothetical protein